jgi:hypothetical protein
MRSRTIRRVLRICCSFHRLTLRPCAARRVLRTSPWLRLLPLPNRQPHRQNWRRAYPFLLRQAPFYRRMVPAISRPQPEALCQSALHPHLRRRHNRLRRARLLLLRKLPDHRSRRHPRNRRQGRLRRLRSINHHLLLQYPRCLRNYCCRNQRAAAVPQLSLLPVLRSPKPHSRRSPQSPQSHRSIQDRSHAMDREDRGWPEHRKPQLSFYE